MPASRLLSRTALGLVLSGSLPLLLTLALPGQTLPRTAPASAASPAPAAGLPEKVADTLDSIVQPRFQKNAGQFGVDRVVHLEGHEGVPWIDAGNRFEVRRFAAVKAAHRSYVIAFLHCRHKPGAHVDPPTPADASDGAVPPSTDALIAVGGTQAGANKTFQWANKALNPVARPYLGQLMAGHPAQADYENWVVVMRPVRALHQACLDCHAGTKRGDTLGVMVYAVDKNAKIKGRSFTSDEGGA